MAVCRAVLSQSTTKDERKGAFAAMVGMQVLGYAVGPGKQPNLYQKSMKTFGRI